MRKLERLSTAKVLSLLALLICVPAIRAIGSSKDLSIEVVETTEEIFFSKSPPPATYSAKVILPDGTHAYLVCFFPGEDCGRIEPSTPPEKTNPAECQYSDYEGGYSSCKRKSLGTYKAKRKGDDLTIYHRKGKVTYRITGPWPDPKESNPSPTTNGRRQP